MIFADYEQPVSERTLYYIASKVNLYGNADIEELVQEGRIRVWQVWQEIEWVRSKQQPVNPHSFYSKVAQRRMQAVCYGKSQWFGGIARQGYTDAMYSAEPIPEDFSPDHPVMEIPFELLDRVPGTFLASMVLQDEELPNSRRNTWAVTTGHSSAWASLPRSGRSDDPRTCQGTRTTASRGSSPRC